MPRGVGYIRPALNTGSIHYAAKYPTAEMFYWIIPYLVAYNVSDTVNWKNGPVHTFESQVAVNVQMETDKAMYTDFKMLFTCRPTIEESTIDCRVQNATIDNYQINVNNSDVIREENATVYEEIFPIDFQVEFDRNGVKNVTFPKPCGFFRENIIRAIIDDLNVGVDLSDKNFEHYVSVDKSINGECPTSFDLKRIPRHEDEVSIEENLDVINMTSTVPVGLSGDQTLVIEKDRKMHKCTKKTPYIFGSDEPYNNMHRKDGFRMELDIVSFRSTIYLGKNRFNSYSEQSGVAQLGIKGEYIKNAERMKMKGKIRVSTKLSLISIDQAIEE